MDVSWSELGRDLDSAIDFDQSELFRKIYESEFGSPGGEPYGAVIGDYEIHPRLSHGALYDDLDVLKSIAGVAAAAFCPFLVNASPAMFGLGDFVELQHTLDHADHMRGSEKWQSLRAPTKTRVSWGWPCRECSCGCPIGPTAAASTDSVSPRRSLVWITATSSGAARHSPSAR